MNESSGEIINSTINSSAIPKKGHSYFMENSREETLRRMETLPERLAELRKRLEKLNASGKTDAD